jgi:L-malate glycosyltransferase
MKEKTILHITAHMGGGVGKVLSTIVTDDINYNHHLLLLEKPIDTQFSHKVNRSQITIAPSVDVIKELIEYSDIVQWDWWNHPLMAGVMHSCDGMGIRSVIWSHTAGCYYPYISSKLVDLPHKLVFTSQYSYDNPYWKQWEHVMIKNNSLVVNSSGGFANTFEVPLKKHDGFNIGYLGALKYSKLNPNFVKFCKSLEDIPHVKFIMVGSVPQPNQVLAEATELGIDHLFEFTGHVPDVSVELARFDVLGYPLNPYSYATSENAMLEAMSMGIPVVCLNQGAEKYLIQDNITGCLVKDIMEYEMTIKYLYCNPDTRKRFGKRAREHVLSHLNIQNTIEKLDAIYGDVLKVQPHKFDYDKLFGKSPYEWYCNGCPPIIPEDLIKYITGNTNSSIGQWCKYYPDDSQLADENKKGLQL